MPDIEKRLEAFVRMGHGFVLFPGGVGSAEELLYILGILMHPANQHQPQPLILTGPESSADYFVITSYSIHYTKLYDGGDHLPDPVGAGAGTQGPLPDLGSHSAADGAGPQDGTPYQCP